MFVFFVNNNFYSFWQNKKGQSFFDLTTKGLALPTQEVSLNYYEGISKIPSLFDFDENKNILIQEKQINIVNDVEVEELVTIQTVNAVAYVINGEKVKPC